MAPTGTVLRSRETMAKRGAEKKKEGGGRDRLERPRKAGGS